MIMANITEVKHPTFAGKPLLIGNKITLKDDGGREWTGYLMEVSWNRHLKIPYGFIAVADWAPASLNTRGLTQTIALPLTDIVAVSGEGH